MRQKIEQKLLAKPMCVNDQIDDVLWANRDVYTVKDNTSSDCVITSVDILRYTGGRTNDEKNQNIVNKFIEKHRKLNKKLREGKFSKFASTFTSFINSAPTLDVCVVLWRGLDVDLGVRVGDVLDKLGFTWWSLSRKWAEYFTNDTNDCYVSTTVIDMSKSRPAKSKPTLIKLNTAKNTKMLDLSYYDHCLKRITSEIILNDDLRLRINEMIELPQYNLIECTVV